jgi:hypothetical protein
MVVATLLSLVPTTLNGVTADVAQGAPGRGLSDYTENAPPRNGVSPLSNRHTALQAAELEVRDGKLVCDRDTPFRIRLVRPD